MRDFMTTKNTHFHLKNTHFHHKNTTFHMKKHDITYQNPPKTPQNPFLPCACRAPCRRHPCAARPGRRTAPRSARSAKIQMCRRLRKKNPAGRSSAYAKQRRGPKPSYHGSAKKTSPKPKTHQSMPKECTKSNEASVKETMS